MKKRILIIMFVFGYCYSLWMGENFVEYDTVCRVSYVDGSSASFFDYNFEIQSVDNVEYSYVVGENFILREGCHVIGSTAYKVDDKVRFKLGVLSFQIKSYRIFPFCFFFISNSKEGNVATSLIGMK